VMVVAVMIVSGVVVPVVVVAHPYFRF
jgi:hypothetical protein